MQRLFGFLALAAAVVALAVLLAGPAIGPLAIGKASLPEIPSHYRAWAAGVLMGLALGALARLDWKRIDAWWGLQRRRLGLLAVGTALAALIVAMLRTAR
ncbi:MAG TPA: hypothetical protein VG758_12020 [Hyphomicrobiaceae bacterium]|jgi:hypothetical protein|nr:hypothetical protein [Hyphomicrobiaceae bacterium]